MGTVQRYLFGWSAATGPVYHYIYADSTGIYEWEPVQGGTALPVDAQGMLDTNRLYTQFWRENYAKILGMGSDLVYRGGDPRCFSPAAVSVSPAGGWVVVNREFDRTLSRNMGLPAVNRSGEARHIQVFKINSTPAPTGDYNRLDVADPNKLFGYTASSVSWLFGPQLLDLTGRDMRMDLADPVYAMRWR